MSDARVRAEARKKKILERGSDRMAIATGQKASTGSTSWRKKKTGNPDAKTTPPGIAVSNEVVKTNKNKETHPSDEVNISNCSDKGVEVVDDIDIDKQAPTAIQSADINKINSDKVLDDIVDSIDIFEFISQDEAKVKEESTKRVLSSVKDYNPVEREKSKAKRKALEQEIARQTEEFDRLADAARKKNASKTNIKDEAAKSKMHKNKADETSVHRPQMKVLRLSKSDWLHIVRFILLTTLGMCIGYLSFQDTVRISSLHASVIDDYFSGDKLVDTSRDLLLKFASEQNEINNSEEVVTTVLPKIWRDHNSSWYILLHYPVLVVIAVILVARFFMAKMMIVDSLVTEKVKGGYLASLLAVAMGDFSGITATLSAFIGDCCLYTLTIFLATSVCQIWFNNGLHPVNDVPNFGEEF